jgi:choline monooxygenase
LNSSSKSPQSEFVPQLLPARAFTDPEVLDVEREKIFASSWLNVGFASEVAKSGDLKTLSVFGLPILITRDKTGGINVFHNVCRHRGHLLVTTERANAGVLTCPYHAWSYDLIGKFRAAPCWGGADNGQPSADTKAGFQLKRIRSAVWCDVIFINTSGLAEPFESYIAPLARRWHPYHLDQFELADLRSYTAQGNWKLAVENFLDAYHFPCIHRQFGTYAVMRKSEPLRISPDIFGYHMATGESDKPKTGSPLLQLEVPEPLRPAQDILYLFPNTLVILTSSWLQFITLLPRGAESTDEQFAIYLVKNPSTDPAAEETRRNFIKAANYINEQDMPVLRHLQAGMQSPVASDGAYVEYWDINPYHFHERLARSVDYSPFATR